MVKVGGDMTKVKHDIAWKECDSEVARLLDVPCNEYIKKHKEASVNALLTVLRELKEKDNG